MSNDNSHNEPDAANVDNTNTFVSPLGSLTTSQTADPFQFPKAEPQNFEKETTSFLSPLVDLLYGKQSENKPEPEPESQPFDSPLSNIYKK